jgi:hypothetical protein
MDEADPKDNAHKHPNTRNAEPSNYPLSENTSRISNPKSEKAKKRVFASRKPISATTIIVDATASADGKRRGKESGKCQSQQCNLSQFTKESKNKWLKKDRPKVIGSQKKITARIDNI